MHRIVSEKIYEIGFTLIELLIVALMIGILLSIAVPNLLKARISANEANARKSLQTIRDAEGEYFEQDLDNAGGRDYTDQIGKQGDTNALRDPAGTGREIDALLDSSFEGALIPGGDNVGAGGGGSGDAGTCTDPKAGYCLMGDFGNILDVNASGGFDDFGWEASMTTFNVSGRKDFAVYGDNVIRCTLSTQLVGGSGKFEATRGHSSCD